jgi:hypothetical protein
MPRKGYRPNPYFEFFVCEEAGAVLEELAVSFPGGEYIMTPFGVAMDQGDTAVGNTWFLDRYDELEKARTTDEHATVLAEQGLEWSRDARRAVEGFASSVRQGIGRLRRENVGPSDLCTELAVQVNTLANSLPALDALTRLTDPRLDPAVDLPGKAALFRNAVHTAAFETAAFAEHNAGLTLAGRLERPVVIGTRGVMVEQMRLLDVSRNLYWMTGDPPESLRYVEGEDPAAYFTYAAEDSEWPDLVKEFAADVRSATTTTDSLGYLSIPPGMTEKMERLAKETRRLVAVGAPQAPKYLELSAVCAETMRGLLDIKDSPDTRREPTTHYVKRHEGAISEHERKERAEFGAEVARSLAREMSREELLEEPEGRPEEHAY